MTKHRVGVKI